MTKAPILHSVVLQLGEAIATKLDAGGNTTLHIKAECPYGCDLHGHIIALTTADGQIVASGALSSPGQMAQLRFAAPVKIASYGWYLRHPHHEANGVAHTDSLLPVGFEIKPHAASLAVWDVPSPTGKDHPFKVTVGATCSAGCNLAGRRITVRDISGALAGAGKLGDLPLPQTRSLHWTEIELAAPQQEGRSSWVAELECDGLEIPHDAASYHFGSEVTRAPEHRMIVKVLDKQSGMPLDKALVRLGLHRACSDETGVAHIDIPSGVYDFDAVKIGYELPSTNLEVSKDLSIQIEMNAVPKQSADAYWYYNPYKHEASHCGS